MKRLLLVPTLFLALLALPACSSTGGPDFGKLLSVVTNPIANPVSATDIYRVKNVYAASLELMAKYRQACWSKPYAQLMADPILKPTCQSRRPAVRAMQAAQVTAATAIGLAEAFVRDHPTLDATAIIGAAMTAATAFQNTMPRAL